MRFKPGEMVCFKKHDDVQSRIHGEPLFRYIAGRLVAVNQNGKAYVREVVFQTFMQSGVKRSRQSVRIHEVYVERLEEIPGPTAALEEIQSAIKPGLSKPTLFKGLSE